MHLPHSVHAPSATARAGAEAGTGAVIELLRAFPTRLLGHALDALDDEAAAPAAAGGPATPGDEDPADRAAAAAAEARLRRRVLLAVLEAMTRPGRIVALPRPEEPGRRLGTARSPRGEPCCGPDSAAALLLRTLLADPATLWLGHHLAHRGAREWLAEHLPAALPRLQPDPARARLAWLSAADAAPALWRLGSRADAGPSESGRREDGRREDDESRPTDRGRTLLIEVPALLADPAAPRLEPGDAELTPRLRLHGPGGTPPVRLAVGGLGRHFWRARAEFGRGEAATEAPAELILLCAGHLAAVPRAARVQLEDAGPA